MGLFSKKSSSTPQQLPQDAPPPYQASPQPQAQPQYAPPPPPSQPQNPDSRPLGEGWISQFDPSSQRFFYVYTPTAHRQWEHPMDRPLGAPERGFGGSNYASPQPYPYPQQQPYYPQQQPYYPQYQQQPVVMANGRRPGGGGMGMAGAAALGLGAGALGFLAADAIADDFGDNDFGGDF
ncbi:hypothetical protein VTP01DRAFT_10778 [Rhizomucor pusillus]|uniref:uncharacterized protein n=1 Tax=Rhizomucor pusillus TaxID=4840 RepID=UPI003743E6B0